MLCTSGFVDAVMFSNGRIVATRKGSILKLDRQRAAPERGRSLISTIAALLLN